MRPAPSGEENQGRALVQRRPEVFAQERDVKVLGQVLEQRLLERQMQDSIFFSININSMINNLDNMRKNLNLVRQRAETIDKIF